MRIKFALLIALTTILMICLTGCIFQRKNAPNIQNGTLDLSGNCSFLNDHSIILQGKWAFYWNKFLLGSDLRNTVPDLYGQVPNAWNDYTLNGKMLPAAGYATYRLHFVSDMPAGTILGLQVPYFISAYRLYINEKEIARNGIVATNRQNEVGRFSPKIVYFTTPAKGFDIVVQVSNFSCAYSGFRNAMSLGTVKNIQLKDEFTYAEIFLTYGIELLIALYALAMYINNRHLTHCLYLFLMCVFTILTIDSVDHQILLQGIMKI
jgi:hypothetical protein